MHRQIESAVSKENSLSRGGWEKNKVVGGRFRLLDILTGKPTDLSLGKHKVQTFCQSHRLLWHHGRFINVSLRHPAVQISRPHRNMDRKVPSARRSLPAHDRGGAGVSERVLVAVADLPDPTPARRPARRLAVLFAGKPEGPVYGVSQLL